MPPFEGYPLLPETAMEGFTYGAITPVNAGGTTGSGFLQGPDGSRAGIQWELSDGPFIARLEAPGADHWGVYRVGFTHPISTTADLAGNLRDLIPKLRILYGRARIH